jgi:hypothetical protein
MHDHVEDGAFAHRKERLGQDGGVGPKAGALASRKDHGSLGHLHVCRQSGRKVEGGAYACSPVRLVGKILYWLAVFAISIALLIVLMLFFESRDDSRVEGSALQYLVI